MCIKKVNRVVDGEKCLVMGELFEMSVKKKVISEATQVIIFRTFFSL